MTDDFPGLPRRDFLRVRVKYLTKAVGIFLKFLWGGLWIWRICVMDSVNVLEFYRNIVVLERNSVVAPSSDIRRFRVGGGVVGSKQAKTA